MSIALVDQTALGVAEASTRVRVLKPILGKEIDRDITQLQKHRPELGY